MAAVNDQIFEVLSELGSEDGEDGEFLVEGLGAHRTCPPGAYLRAYLGA